MKKLIFFFLILPSFVFADEIAFQCKMKWVVGTGIYEDTRLINTDWTEELYKYDKRKNVLTDLSKTYSCITDDDKLMCDKIWNEKNTHSVEYVHIHRKTLDFDMGRVVRAINNETPTDSFLYEGECQIVENQF